MPVANSAEAPGPLGASFTRFYSLQSLLADCGGCVVASRGVADGDDISVYLPLDKEVLQKVVRVFNESDARWDSLLDQHIDDLLRLGLTVIHPTVVSGVVDVVRPYIKASIKASRDPKEVFCELLDVLKRNVDVKHQRSEFVNEFLEKLCDTCHESYQVRCGDQDSKNRHLEIHVFKARYDTRSREMKLQTGSFNLENELVLDVVTRLGQILDMKLNFWDCERKKKAEEQSEAKPEDLESAFVRLYKNWEEGIIKATEKIQQANTSPWRKKMRRLEAGVRLLLLQTFLIDKLAFTRPRCRRDVIGTIVGTILKNPYVRITRLTADYDDHLGKSVRFILNGKLPQGQKFRVVLMDTAAGTVLSHLPIWQSFPRPRKFLDGFVYLSVTKREDSTWDHKWERVSNKIRLIKNKDDPLPAWWGEYFKKGEQKTCYYLEGRIDGRPISSQKPRLASWVSDAGSRNPSILSTNCLNQIRLEDEIDIIFSNGIANLQPKDLLSEGE